MKIDLFRKKTTRSIHIIKTHSIWISIHGEIKDQTKEIENLIIKREKMTELYEIKLIEKSHCFLSLHDQFFYLDFTPRFVHKY